MDTQSRSINQLQTQINAIYRRPEGVCGQEVHAVVCSLPEDAQKVVHTQFDSKPGQYPM